MAQSIGENSFIGYADIVIGTKARYGMGIFNLGRIYSIGYKIKAEILTSPEGKLVDHQRNSYKGNLEGIA